ncbi:hypothetical protein L873DRAFT_1689777 [Choiromyces venosus 120613-1]|uniref:Major facilitator superfamily (MFS) profile domain-containing protein n=1 Tax=Choiromyces venosus 120613-1 TaxID=1336337 RepID=A0A3N4JHK2_9PEZI|nr:hypothetical protein L873DRAFT_1689777 [Choiromyces venosus 120613-1]
MEKVEIANTVTDGEKPSPVRHPTSSPPPIMSDPTPDRLLANPLAGLQRAELVEHGRRFVEDHNLGEEYIGLFERAAVLAQNPLSFRDPDSEFRTDRSLEEERDVLERELTHKWDQPKSLYALVVTCALGAMVQGWNERVFPFPNTFYKKAFKITDNEWIYGLVNSAPYLCCAIIGCWLTEPLNHYFGRRGTIFISCAISSVTCLGQGLTQTWWQMLVTRFLLGLGIGPKSATIPVYASECTPSAIRGGLVMMWQMWTAFGIMLGLLTGVAVLNVGHSTDTMFINWRLMTGSPMFLPLIVCALVYFNPESPRWHIKNGNYSKAFESLIRLRHSDIQAARDLIYINVLLEREEEISRSRNRLVEIFTIPRNRHALQASLIAMIMQQLCGVNVLVYYSASVLQDFKDDYHSIRRALLGTMGFGLINFVFALPAVFTIDTFGRRNLLLVTFPLMALFMLITCLLNNISNGEGPSLTLIGMYLFTVVYSPGEGPVPFVYSAECYPLYIRDIGMSIATAVTWFFNWLLAFTWPPMHNKIGSAAFGMYAGLNVVGFVFILLLVPETRNRTLEELDAVFQVPSKDQAMYGIRQLGWLFGRWIWGQGAVGKPVLVVGGGGGIARDRGMNNGGVEMESGIAAGGVANDGQDRPFPVDDSSSVNRVA